MLRMVFFWEAGFVNALEWASGGALESEALFNPEKTSGA